MQYISRAVSRIARLGVSILTTSLLAIPVAQANIVANGGFESGDFTGWTVHDCSKSNCAFSGYGITKNYAQHSGSFAAYTACDGAVCLDQTDGDYLQQTLTTTAGATYQFSFWVRGFANDEYPNAQAVYWNGALVGMFTNVDATYQQFTINGLVATSFGTVLQINGRDDPDGIVMDDIDVEQVAGPAGVPEPASSVLFGGGLLALVLTVRRRRDHPRGVCK